MKLLFLHGAPATGKLTAAKALLSARPGRLLENHAALDFAQTIFEFGAPGFWQLVHQVRLAALESAARGDIPLLVMTFCYSDPVDRPYFTEFGTLLRKNRGELLPVFLHCSEEETVRRIGNADRVKRRKISSMESLKSFRTVYNDEPVPRADCLKLDSGVMPAAATAQRIIGHFRL